VRQAALKGVPYEERVTPHARKDRGRILTWAFAPAAYVVEPLTSRVEHCHASAAIVDDRHPAIREQRKIRDQLEYLMLGSSDSGRTDPDSRCSQMNRIRGCAEYDHDVYPGAVGPKQQVRWLI
jgi:hypothetical protein